MENKTKLHLGCGWRNFGPGWIHIDGGTYDHLNYYDITNLSQFSNNSVDIIYASHVIEYFDRREILPILQEWYRILKPKGILRIAVPDFDVMTSLYQNRRITLDQILGPLYGKMQMGDSTIYHKTTYDFDSLEDILHNDIGFDSVDVYDWRKTEHAHIDDHSQAYIPHMDKENGILISLNIEAIK